MANLIALYEFHRHGLERSRLSNNAFWDEKLPCYQGFVDWLRSDGVGQALTRAYGAGAAS